MTDINVINYTGIFVGIGAMALLFALTYFFFQISRSIKNDADKEQAYATAEQTALDKTLERCGLDVNKYVAKRNLLNTKTFRKALEDKMVKEMLEGNTTKK